MSNYKKSFMLFFVFSTLMGCKEEFTSSYLLQHPLVLKQEVENCQVQDEKSQEEASRCEAVMSAAARLMSIINEQQQDPEKFGQLVLNTEFEYSQTKSALHTAQMEFAALNKQASVADRKTAQTKLDDAKRNYAQQKEEMQILLVVLGMGSPE